MAKTTEQIEVGHGTVLSPTQRAQFYRNKLDAEWGPWDLKHEMDDDPNSLIILDTRPAEAYAEEHIKGAINIPTDELPGRLDELDTDKDIVPYCFSVVCHLATRASLYLAEKGYTVHELAGGIEYWKNYKMPVEGSAPAPSKS